MLRPLPFVFGPLTTLFCLSAALAFVLPAAAHAAPSGAEVAEAAMRGDRDTVRALLKDGADVNSAQGDGMTALHWAAMKEDAALAEMLLYAGANVKATTRLGGYTPLMLAAKNGSAPLLRAIIQAGADVRAATATGVTPLMLAAASGRADAVRVLLAHGADLKAVESTMQQDALMFAAAYNRIDAMKALLDAGAEVAAATKVVDLYAFSREVEEQFRQFRQQGGPGPSEGQQAPQGQAAVRVARALSGDIDRFIHAVSRQ